MYRTYRTRKRAQAMLALTFLAGSVHAQDSGLDSQQTRITPSRAIAAKIAQSRQAASPRMSAAQPIAPTNAGRAAPASATLAAMGLADFERLAMEHNPTLRQAAAQIDATMSRSHQAGLYPNPTVGYVQEQIGALGEVTPTASGISTSGKGTPGELVGGYVEQEFVTGGKLRLSRAKFAEEANAARWQSEAQTLRVLNGVRVRFFEVLAAQRLIQIHRELVQLNDDAVRTTEQLVNVGQANEPDLLQAKVEARRARVALRNAENHYRGNWENLVSVVGTPDLRPSLSTIGCSTRRLRPSTSTPLWPTCLTAVPKFRRRCPRSAAARSW